MAIVSINVMLIAAGGEGKEVSRNEGSGPVGAAVVSFNRTLILSQDERPSRRMLDEVETSELEDSGRREEKDKKWKELVMKLMKYPVETFDTLMIFLANSGGVDEEDIADVEELEECEEAKDAGNFLHYIKEKHLLQAIDYCSRATDMTIDQHVINVDKWKQKTTFMNSAQQSQNMVRSKMMEEFKQSDDAVEVIGYVGCTDETKVDLDLMDMTPAKCKDKKQQEEQPAQE